MSKANTDKKLIDLSLPTGIRQIDQVLEGYKSYQVLVSALELGLFDLLAERGPTDREELIETLKISGMLSRSYLKSLVDMGFLVNVGERYANAQVAANFLVRSSLFYQGDCVKLFSGPNSQWSNLTATLTEKVYDEIPPTGGPSKAVIDAIGQRALRGELQEVTRAITTWEGFSQASTILDVAGGHGLYAIALCQENPSLKGAIFDQPQVIEYAKEYISRYQLEDRLQVQSGDIRVDDLGEGYDIVIISHLLYKFRDNLGAIFDKVSASLKPGGLLVTNHWFCAPGCGAGADCGSNGIVELEKSLHSSGHPLCHPEDFQGLFWQKGFEVIQAADIPSVFDTSKLYLAVKKETCCAGAGTDYKCC